MAKFKMRIDTNLEPYSPDSMGLVKSKDWFIFDFKENTPVLEPSGNKEEIVINLKHIPIKMNPKLAKAVYAVLGENIKDYEKRFGVIELPKVKKGRAKSKTIDKPQSYIG